MKTLLLDCRRHHRRRRDPFHTRLFPPAFPTIVTPYGLAAVTVLITLAPTTEISLMLTGVVYLILFLDWFAMLTAHARWLGPAAAPRRDSRRQPGGTRLAADARLHLGPDSKGRLSRSGETDPIARADKPYSIPQSG